jgi:hypothetical protein
LNEEKFTHYQPFRITKAGLALRQRAIAGGVDGEPLLIDFTRGAIGQGKPVSDDDIHYMTALVQSAVDVPIKENYAQASNHIMTVVIDGAQIAEDIMMTEVGIFARLVDAAGTEIIPETLYGYTYTEKYDYVPAGGTYNLYREIAFNTVLSQNGTFEITFDKEKVYVTRKEFDSLLNALGGIPATDENGKFEKVLIPNAIELSGADIPGQGTKVHLRIWKTMQNWETPAFDGTEDVFSASLFVGAQAAADSEVGIVPAYVKTQLL